MSTGPATAALIAPAAVLIGVAAPIAVVEAIGGAAAAVIAERIRGDDPERPASPIVAPSALAL
jgi:hypothetical protein